MAHTIQNPLSENQIQFILLWRDNVLTRKHNIDVSIVNQAAVLVGYTRSGTCSSCNRNDVIELNNLYNRLSGQYDSYIKMVDDSTKQKQEKELLEIQHRKDLITKKRLSTLRKKREEEIRKQKQENDLSG